MWSLEDNQLKIFLAIIVIFCLFFVHQIFNLSLILSIFLCLVPTPQKNKIKATSILNLSKLKESKASQKLSQKSPQKLSKESQKQNIKRIAPKITPITPKSITREIIKPKVIIPNIITPKIIIPNILAPKTIKPNLSAQNIITYKVAPKLAPKIAPKIAPPKIAQTIVKHH